MAAPSAPTREIGAAVPGLLPSWSAFAGSSAPSVFKRDEHVPELRWPRSVRETFPRMATDTQLHALMAGTVLPTSRYAWGIDENGASPAVVEGITRDFNVPLIADALAEHDGRASRPLGRSKNRFSLSKHRELAYRALATGHYFFEQVGDISDDDGLWHLRKLLPLPPRTIGQFRIEQDGGLEWIKQTVVNAQPIPVTQLVAYVWNGEPGDWTGTSMFRPCYREWLIKDRLLRVDAINHEKAGGILINEAPANATPAELARLSELAAAAQVGGGGAVPAGTNPIFIRGTGSDVIGSINRHDEAMARAFLLMSIQLGSTQSGARSVGVVQQELWAYSQLAIADWFRDTFSEHAIEDWVDWNYGPDEPAPRLVYVDVAARDAAQSLRPADQLAQQGATIDKAVAAALNGEPAHKVGALRAQVARENREYRAHLSRALPYLFNEQELEQLGDLADRDAEIEEELHTALADGLPPRATRLPRATRAAAAVSLPDRPLRREPFPHEMQAATDFAKLDTNWANSVQQLVDDWKAIRAGQITQLAEQIAAADGDLATLAQIQAAVDGGDLIAARLTAMAHTGAAEAVAEAAAQGVADAAHPDLAALQAQLASRAAALEQLLAQSLSQAAANKAVQISGGGLAPAEVAAQVTDYLGSLTDAYLTDQFGGAMSAAQNAGRLEAMDTNNASRFYASELLDLNTCGPCADIDGTEYATADEAATDYPAGGYRDCDGGPRCRGTVVAVYGEAAASENGGAFALDAQQIADQITLQLKRTVGRQLSTAQVVDVVDTAVAPLRAELEHIGEALAAIAAQPAAETPDLSELEPRFQEVRDEVAHVAAAIPQPADIDRAGVEQLLADAIHPLHLALERLGGDVRAAVERANSRPRRAVATRGPNGELEVTYPDDQEPS